MGQQLRKGRELAVELTGIWASSYSRSLFFCGLLLRRHKIEEPGAHP